MQGIVVMSGPLETMYNCFLLNRVPPAWENAGYPCLKVRGEEGPVMWIEMRYETDNGDTGDTEIDYGDIDVKLNNRSKGHSVQAN